MEPFLPMIVFHFCFLSADYFPLQFISNGNICPFFVLRVRLYLFVSTSDIRAQARVTRERVIIAFGVRRTHTVRVASF